jgi:hypothetical protein
MNTRTEILNAFDQGKTPEELKKSFAPGSIFKYKRLHLVMQIERKIRDVLLKEKWEDINLPELKRVLKEVERW